MAKASSKAYKVEIAGHGIVRIDGIVHEVTDAGVTIAIKQPGRVVRTPTMIPMSAIIAHTGEGAGYVIANTNYQLEPIAGTVTEEDEGGVTLQDADGVEIRFPSNGANGAKFIQVAEDDRSLNRGSVETKIARLAERAAEGGSRKKKSSKKGAAAAAGKSSKKSSKKGKRRAA